MEQQSGALFTIRYMNPWLEERRRTIYVDDMANLLVGPVFSHPSFKDGAPFQMTFEEVAEAYQECLGGKTLWKVHALRDDARFGVATPRVAKLFREAGFKVTFATRARPKKTKRQEVEGDLPMAKCPRLCEEMK
jgi:hypothetical protein